MYLLTVSSQRRPWNAHVLVAFFAIYVLWGATFLAIRIAVFQIPPLFTAGLRFLVAGVCLYLFMRLRGVARPSLIEWRNLAIVALCMFVLTYGPLFWAEQYVSSSATAVIQATLPLTTIAFEVFVFRSLALQAHLVSGVLLGFGGVALLLFHNTGQHLAIVPCCDPGLGSGVVIWRSVVGAAGVAALKAADCGI